MTRIGVVRQEYVKICSLCPQPYVSGWAKLSICERGLAQFTASNESDANAYWSLCVRVTVGVDS